MNTCRVVWLCLLGVGLWAGRGVGNPVDLSAPGGELGSANPKGYLEIWREIDGVGLQLGQGSYLPLRYKFSSDPAIGGVLGPGFYLPMFEARNVLIRESTMRAYLPCGKGLYFWRDTVDHNKFKTVDQEWTGYLTGEGGEDFTVWRNDGWKVFYHKSRLTSIISDDKHTFTWTYDGLGGGSTVSENGQSLLTLERNGAGQVAALIFDGKRYEVGYAQRPVTELLLGQVAVKELDPALGSFKYPDGTMDTFKLELTPDRIPTLTFTDKDKRQTLYTWSAETGALATEKGPKGNWTYKIGEIADQFAAPALSRTNSEGKTEGMTVDNKMGVYIARANNGVSTVTHVFESPGPLYHKVRYVEQIKEGETTTIYKASYDEGGRLIRKIDQKGFVTTYTYDDKGQFLNKIVNIPSDPTILAKLKQKEETLLTQLAKTSNSEEHGDLLEELAFLYIHDFGIPKKALALLPQISDRKQAFNIQMHSIDGDRNLTGQQKAEQFKSLVKEYPEETHLLDILISARLRDDMVNIQRLNASSN
jgi:YD repeat-containing protein